VMFSCVEILVDILSFISENGNGSNFRSLMKFKLLTSSNRRCDIQLHS